MNIQPHDKERCVKKAEDVNTKTWDKKISLSTSKLLTTSHRDLTYVCMYFMSKVIGIQPCFLWLQQFSMHVTSRASGDYYKEKQ